MSKDNRGSSAHANGGAAGVKKALFFGGSTPFLWASTKEMGSKGRTSQKPPPNVSAHTYKAKTRRHLICALCVCAVFLGRSPSPLLPIPPHFFALAQRNGVEPQRNALMGAATVAVRSRPPLPRTRSPNITADCVKLTLPGQFTHRVQINLTHQFVPLGLRAEWERRAGPPSSCGGFKGAFLWRLDTVSLGKHQRNGVESQGKLTKTSQRNGAHAPAQDKENPPAGFSPGVGSQPKLK